MSAGNSINIRDAVITFKPGTGTAFTVTVGEGDLTYKVNRNIVYIKDRGHLDDTRLGDDVPMTVDIDAVWKAVSTNNPDTILGPADGSVPATLTSSDSNTCRPYAVDVVVTLVQCGVTKTITFPNFRWESKDFSLKNATLKIAGKCNATEPVEAIVT